MNQDLIIYHGSQLIVEVPRFGVGKKYNDYGQGFYCTESIELAKEWACPVKKDGYANKYRLTLEGLKVMHLTGEHFNILNWLAILLAHRQFDINSPIGAAAKDFILERFTPNIAGVDVMIGYRADDSYFSFAADFVNNTLSLRDLNFAMRLGTLGEQIVLLSPRAFGQISFLGYEIADFKKYYYQRDKRDQAARLAYQEKKRNWQQFADDLFILDIMREDMRNDDSRLQSALSR